MKRFLSIMFFLGLVMTMQSQSFCLKLSEVSNDGNDYVVKVEMQGDVAFNLGSSNLQFSYEDAALGTPSLLASTLAPPFYFIPTITTPNSGQASLNIELGFPNAGTTVPATPDYFELATITFPIINAEAIGGLAWSYNGGTTETVVFLEDEATQMFAVSPECLLGIEAPVTGLANDLCAGAFEIACGESATGSTTEATADAELAGCTTSVSTAPGVWYSIVGTGLEMSANTNGSTYDTKMGVYGGSCDALECISTNDDGGAGLQSLVTWASDAGITYYIYVTGFSSASGDYVLNTACLTEAEGCTDAAACNFNSAAGIDDGSCVFAVGCDTCSGETDGTGTVIDNLESGEVCDDGNPDTTGDVIQANCECSGVAGNQSCATAEAIGEGFFTAPNPNAGGGASLVCQGTDGAAGTNAVWYAYTASFTGDALISSCLGGQDTRVSVFAGTCDALGECIANNDDTCPHAPDGSGASFAAEVLVPVTAGQTYLVEWDDRWTDGGFDFSITNASVEPILGCTNTEACNYNELANTDDDSCILAEGCDVCDGEGGVIDNNEIGTACDDGDDNTENDVLTACDVCAGTPIEIVLGCTDEAACNFNPAANTDDDSCDFGQWYIPEVIPSGSVAVQACETPEGYILADQECAAFIVFNDSWCSDNSFDGLCTDAYNECLGVLAGCTDVEACNYDELAEIDDESCVFAEGCDACNEDGTVDDNPEIGDACDDGDDFTIFDIYVDCGLCIGTLDICFDPNACNYNELPSGVSASGNENRGIVGGGSCIYAFGCDECSGDIDGTGFVIDNPEIGDACDDGDDNTENDMYISCDLCEGTPLVDAPENDLCEGALPIACGETATGSTATASADASLVGCTTSVTTAPGVWYSFLGTGTEMNINTNGSTYDTKLGVYGGICDALECIATNDDGGIGLQSQVIFTSDLDVTYYAYVTGFSASNGDYVLNIICADVLGCTNIEACNYNADANIDDESCILADGCDACDGEGGVIDNPEIGDACDDGDDNTENDVLIACDLCEGSPIDNTPENDLCEGALPIACGESATGSTVTATVDADLVGCFSTVNTAPGVWYSFVGTGAEMNINTNGSAYDTKLGVYGGTCDALECIATNDDGGDGLQSLVIFTSELDVTYYAYVTGFSASNGDYILNIICVEDVLGCTNIEACNYNADANIDDESCILAEGCDVCDGEGGVTDNPEIGDACDDGDDNTVNDVLIACDLCEGTPVIEIFGCADAEACNYDATATTDDGSCTYGLIYIPIDFNASESEPAIQACEAPEGYVLGDQDCLIAIILDDAFCIEVDWDLICEDAYQECLGINECQLIESSMWGEGPWMNGGTQYTFVAENANDAILAQGEGDVSIEVFDGECGGASLGVFNNYGAGQIERAVPGNLIAGNTYSYFVTTEGDPESVMSKVKKYAVTLIKAEYCNSTMELIDQIYCSREEDMYNNPAVNVTGFSFKFVHQVTGDEIIITDLASDGFYQQLITIAGFELGATYDVSASHQVIQNANGSIQSLFSNYGPSCPITIESQVPLTNVRDQYCGGESTFSLSDMIKAVKVTGADQYEWIFDNGSEQITHQTVGYPLLLWQVAGLEYGSAYTITVRAHLNGNWGAFGSSCTILMDSQPNGTKVRDTHCGLDYLIPSSQLLFADVVFAASEYTWEFNDGTGIQEFTSLNYKLLLNSTGLSTGFYDVRVKAFAGGVYGDYAMSCEISINGGGPGIIKDDADLAVKSYEPSLEATIYPNPNSGDNVSLNVTNLSDESKKVIVEVMDLFGKKVYSEQLASNGSTFQYELRFNQNLPTGLYLVHILVDGKTITEKLVVE